MPLARMICANAELSKTDLRFNQAYAALRQQLDSAGRERLQQEDLEFLTAVQRFCGVPESGPITGSPDCVGSQYDHQRAQWLSRLSGPAYEEANRPIEQHVALQAALQQLGFLPPTGKIDGVYRPATRSAIIAWQTASGRPVTGIVSDAEAAALARAAPQQSAGIRSPAESLGVPAPHPEPPLPAPAHVAAQPTAAPMPAPTPSTGASTGSNSGVVVILILLGIVALFWRRGRRTRAGGTRAKQSAIRTPTPSGPSERVREKPQIRFRRPAATTPSDFSISSGRGSWQDRPRGKTLKVEGDRCWIPKGQSASIAGYVIADGMIYLGKQLARQDGYGVENCLIDPGLPVAARDAGADGDGLSYYPAYNRLLPESRRAYLLWLASGKNDPTANIGYVFVYFYGLERRLILDRSTKEHDTLVAEVQRLNGLYSGNHSFASYSRRLLDAARLIEPARKFYDEPPPQETHDFELPLTVRLAVGQLISEGKPVPVDWMFAWLIADPNTRLRTAATRARKEFEELFRIRFAEKYPQGVKITPPKQRLKHSYRASSGSFVVDLSKYVGDLPDVAGLTAPTNRMRELAEPCIEALDPYSRLLGRQPEARGSFRAISLLPPDLAHRIEGDEVRKLRQEIDGTLANGPKLVEVRELLSRINGNPPTLFGKPALQACADALAYFEIGVAPDPRTAFQLPKPDQPIVLFKLPQQHEGAAADQEPYRHALLFLSFAAYVAHADGVVSPAKREWLETFVQTTAGLDEAARVRLDANVRWLLAVPPELGPLRARLTVLPPGERHELGVVALSVACAGGAIDPAEIKALQRIYKAIGLDQERVLNDIHTFLSGIVPPSDPVTIRIGGREPHGYAIPKPPAPPPPERFQLDPARVQQISESTRRVNEILAKVFASDEIAEAAIEPSAAEPPPSAPHEADAPEAFDGLDTRYRGFVGELLTREAWPREDIDTLARMFELMPDGAIEAINEWAFDRYGDALLEDGEPIAVNAGLLGQGGEATTTRA
jgi:LPXTG-motif cell wall-anchored protein